MIQVNRIYLIFNRLVTKKFLVDTSDFGYKFEVAPELQKMSYKATLRDESLNEFLAALDSITPQMSYHIDVNRKIVKVRK